MSRREYEQQVAHEEAQQLRSLQAAVAAEPTIVHGLKETPLFLWSRNSKQLKESTDPSIRHDYKVKPQAKRAMIDEQSVERSDIVKTPDDTRKSPDRVETSNGDTHTAHNVTKTVKGLVSYSDESRDDA